MIAPKPQARADHPSLWAHFRAFRRDILSAQPERLYAAKMAEFRTPFFRSYLLGEPDLISEVLERRPDDFPKSDRVASALLPLLGKRSVFLTNGQVWRRQRRIINPAFQGGRIGECLPAMQAAIDDALNRLDNGALDVEEFTSRLTADIIFRTLFSVPITDDIAARTYRAFRTYQETAPLLNGRAFLRILPAFHSRKRRLCAREIRGLTEDLVSRRMIEIAAGTAPDDLATRILSQKDPQTGERFDRAEMVDQVAIFFLAGHETSAAALAWAIWLLAQDGETQTRARAEAARLGKASKPADIKKLAFIDAIFAETLRLYPPVPMMVRKATCPERFRDRAIRKGSQLVVSPWHTHRNPRFWSNADAFCPERFATDEGRASMRDAYFPYSKGARICPGAGFAQTEAVLALALLLQRFDLSPASGPDPIPRAHLTVRSANGIRVALKRRDHSAQG